jgi:hypothetical protein
VFNAVVVLLAFLAPRSDHASLVTYTSWSLVSKGNSSLVKALIIILSLAVRIVLLCLLVSLSFLLLRKGRPPARTVP